ncbi:MAG: regulator of cell morphogenesis and NO signaling [Crocinitomix sp.]|jgi:regulator of cell morphogenesis and NO signaling
MKIDKETLIGEIVSEDYRLASYFKEQKIDFCCNGNRSIETVCELNNISMEKMLNEIESAMQISLKENNYSAWDIGFLSEYIYQNHHTYVEEKIIEIKPYLDKICEVHGAAHPELFEIKELFIASANELTMHMKKEELMLFPYFKKLAKADKEGSAANSRQFDTLESPISQMHKEHDNEGERFRKIEALTNNYTPPANACSTYRVSFSLLKAFQDDLHKHIHLENNILFKKAIELEQKIKIKTKA